MLVSDISNLIAEAKYENDKWRLRHRNYMGLLIAFLVSVCIFLVLGLEMRRYTFSPYAHFIPLALICLCGSEGVGLLSKPTVRHRHLMKVLAQGHDTRLVGSLLEAIRPAWTSGLQILHGDKELWYSVIAALTRLLPQLSIQEYRMLTSPQRQALYQMLKNNFPEVVLPALETVVRFDDTAALPNIKRLAARKGENDATRRVAVEAKKGLVLLQGKSRH